MIKLGKLANNIPTSLFLNASDLKVDRQSWPVAQGGFADVYEGEFRGNRVALKRVHQKAIDQVRAFFGAQIVTNAYPKGIRP